MLPSKASMGSLVNIMVEVQTETDPKTIGGFVEQLRKMLNNLVEAQNKHKNIHEKMMKECFDEDRFRAKEVADAKLAMSRAALHKAKCKKSLKAAEKALPTLKSTLKTYRNELARATKEREEQNKSYKARKADYEEAIAFLEDFIKYVKQKLKGHFKAFALVQFSENLLQHATKLGAISAAVPALVAIAEASYKASPVAHDYEFQANESLGAKLKQILEDLLALLKKDHRLNEEQEAKSVRIFLKYKARLLAVISTLVKNIKRTKKQINDMHRCIDHEARIFADASKKLSRNATLKANAIKMCNSFNNEFIDATKNRLDEIKTMKEILEIVARRFKNLPQDIISYLQDIENGWKAYINSTVFKKYVTYRRVQFVKNARGEELLNAKNLLK
jgi:hypothetical protein